MISSKRYFEKDIDSFINLEEFGEIHNINGRKITIVKDNDELKERTKNEYDGVYIGDILYFVKACEYGQIPEIEELQTFDDIPAIVVDVKENMGIYEILLRFNGS